MVELGHNLYILLVVPPELSAIRVLPVLDLGSGFLLSCSNFVGLLLCNCRLPLRTAKGLAGLIAEHLFQTFWMSFGTSFLWIWFLAMGTNRSSFNNWFIFIILFIVSSFLLLFLLIFGFGILHFQISIFQGIRANV